MEAHKGFCHVCVRVEINDELAKLAMPLRVAPSEQLCEELNRMEAVKEVCIRYPETIK